MTGTGTPSPAADSRGGEKGFTLLEVLVALLLLVIGLLTVITVFWSSATSGVMTRQATTAACLGEDILERAKTMSFNTLAATSSFVDYTAANGSASGYTRRWKVTDEADGTKKVSAEVSWQGGFSGTRSRTFSMTRRADF